MPHPTRQAIVRWAAAVLLTPVLYFLSSGPAVYLSVRGNIHPTFFGVVYGPILSACDHSGTIAHLWDSWLVFWVSLPPVMP